MNTCKATKRDVVIFSLEMGKEQLVSRMLASEALVNNTLLRSGNLEPSDWEKIAGAADESKAQKNEKSWTCGHRLYTAHAISK